jgi:chromosome segregation ATPase
VDERALDDLRELARRDEELAGGARRLRELDGQIGAIRARAEAIGAFFAGYPTEEARRRAVLEAAEAAADRRAAELAAAEREAVAAGDNEEARVRAAAVVDRARDHVSVAEASLARARDSAAELERDAASLPEEVPLLEERARAIAAEVPHVPAPASGPRGLVDWASHAHAELFVAAGQLDAQRERVIREANELATMLLGEPTYGSTVAQLAQRVFPLARE